MPTYTYDSKIHVSYGYLYYEWRLFLLAAIEQARLDVVSGVTDGGASREDRALIRSDALAFFVDGRWHTLLEFCGVKTTLMADGVGVWIERMSEVARQAGYKGDDPIVWGHEQGLFDDEDVWERASGDQPSRQPAHRLRLEHLDSGRDNMIKKRSKSGQAA